MQINHGHRTVFTTDALPGMLGLIAQNLMLCAGHPVAVVRIHPDGSVLRFHALPTWFPVIEQLSSLQDPTIRCAGSRVCLWRAYAHPATL